MSDQRGQGSGGGDRGRPAGRGDRPQQRGARSGGKPGGRDDRGRSGGKTGGKPAGSAVKKFASRVVELAYVRDRIDRGFGDERVFAMQNEEVYAVAAARADAAPALHQLSWFRFRSGPGY